MPTFILSQLIDAFDLGKWRLDSEFAVTAVICADHHIGFAQSAEMVLQWRLACLGWDSTRRSGEHIGGRGDLAWPKRAGESVRDGRHHNERRRHENLFYCHALFKG
jgi:hypothetical protein